MDPAVVVNRASAAAIGQSVASLVNSPSPSFAYGVEAVTTENAALIHKAFAHIRSTNPMNPITMLVFTLVYWLYGSQVVKPDRSGKVDMGRGLMYSVAPTVVISFIVHMSMPYFGLQGHMKVT
jgi:hypothetical protein